MALPLVLVVASLFLLPLVLLLPELGVAASASPSHSSSSSPSASTSPHRQVLKPPPHLAVALPSQFELAMTHTLQAVTAGQVTDPAMRRPDGTPGTLLDALLPQTLSEEEKALHRRRKLGRAAGWRLFGANIPFATGPTLSAFNSSFYRYSSVEAPPSVDWRKTMYITPILIQYDCPSCWAMAAADTVAMATAIATSQPAVAPGVQQICDCSTLTCCQGGWPEDAFAWMVGNGNITTAASYNYWASDGRVCSVKANYPTAGNITGWERVPTYSQDALMNAVSMQPVLVYISASTKDFQNYSSTAPGTTGFRIYDGNCTSEVNHAVVVVGYDTTGIINYWIIKNTWPADGWGDNGYMYIRMNDGPGKCGMQTVNPIFPVNFPNAPVQATVQAGSSSPVLYRSSYWWNWWQPQATSPCSGIINPCGGGSCYQASGIARCLCPSPYVEIVGVPTSKCVDPSPCTSGMFGPCGIGSCMDVGDGTYVCGCPAGYAIGTRVNGAPTCVPLSALGIKARTYVVQYGDNCTGIQAAFNLSASSFVTLNPYINCARPLLPGYVVTVSPNSSAACTQLYAARPGDNCGTIAYYMDKVNDFPSNWLNPKYWCNNCAPTELYTVYSFYNYYWYSPGSLLALNPTLNCSSGLMSSQQLCVAGSTSAVSSTPIQCGQTYVTVEGDSCSSIRAQFGLNSTYFRQLNPGIYCSYNNNYFYGGVQICVAPTTSTVNSPICAQWYTVQQGDTCAQIWNAANLSQFQMMYINPGLQCQPPFLYVGLQICVDSPVLSNISDPNYLLYTVQPNDTWGYIQGQFASRCIPSSITTSRIAAQNNISSWMNYTLVVGTQLIIPCVPKIGAFCGCVDSLSVCGANLVSYNSYCEARCNFDTPVTSGACTTCQIACQGRYGLSPSPTTACAAGYTCPWPQWPPPTSDASAVYSSSPLCSYRQQTCTRACTLYNSATNTPAADTTCYNSCYACDRVPCSGPNEIVPVGSGTCATCSTSGCQAYSKSACSTQCNYWNSFWNPINP